MLYFMLVGRPPFSGETVIDQIVRTATEPLRFPAPLAEDCRALCARMLAKDPAERFPDGTAVVAALEALAKGQPIHTATPLPAKAEPLDETEEGEAVDETPGTPGGPRLRRRVPRRRR